jgi:hypothetical protein
MELPTFKYFTELGFAVAQCPSIHSEGVEDVSDARRFDISWYDSFLHKLESESIDE